MKSRLRRLVHAGSLDVQYLVGGYPNPCLASTTSGREPRAFPYWLRSPQRHSLISASRHAVFHSATASRAPDRQTFMADVDSHGRVIQFEQVLDPRRFALVTPGATRDGVLRTIGQPSDRAPLRDGEMWAWRYANRYCVWYQIELDQHGPTVSASLRTRRAFTLQAWRREDSAPEGCRFVAMQSGLRESGPAVRHRFRRMCGRYPAR
jgi:hypothetical protein